MLNIIKNTINRVFASGVDSDASAFITATGLSGTTQKSAITTLVKDLKASGLWSKMKAVYPMVTDNYNLLSYTEDFSNAYWIQSQVTIAANTIVSPIGTSTADTMTETSSTSTHGIVTDLVSFINGVQYTSSVYVKNAPGGRGFFQLSAYQITSTSQNAYCDFDIINGTVGGTSNATGQIQNIGNGWFRCSMTVTSGRTYTERFNALLIDNINATSFQSYAGSTSRSLYIWGAQLEASAAASTYQPIAITPSAFMASQMKYNLKDARDLDAAFRLTWSGGWTYSATGATPNGTNAYADTKLNQLANLSDTSNHISLYSRTNATTTQIDCGITNGSTYSFMQLWSPYVTNNYNFENGSQIISSPYTNSIGLFLGTATSSTLSKLYKNGSLLNSSTTTQTKSLFNSNILLANTNNSITNLPLGSFYSNKQYAFATIGNGLTDQDASLLNQIVEKYQVALSRGVQAAQSFYYNSAYSNEANTYLYSTQITGTTQVSAINTLINGLKANNLWSKMKAVYPFVTDYRNLLAYTQSFTNAYWDKSITTVIDANTTDPNGTTTASKLTEAAGTGSHHIHNSVGSFTPVVGQAYAMSCYVKQTPTATNRYVQLPFFIAGFGSNAYVNFDVQDGVVGTIGSSITSYSITLGNDGWYRITATATATATGSSGFQLSFIPSATSTRTESYTVTAGNEKSIYMWGVQIEMGSTASVYQPVLGVNNYSTNVAAQMKFNLVNPQDSDAAFRLAFSGGWTYSTNGAQPNGTNGYADTFLIPSTNLTESSKHLSFYLRTDNLPINADPINIGALSGTQRDFLLHSRVSINGQLSSVLATNLITNPLGYSLITRSSITNNLFKNNSKVNTASGAGTSSTGKIFVGSLNLNGGSYGFTNNQLALASIGDGLSDAEAAVLYQLIQDYQTTLSRQV